MSQTELRLEPGSRWTAGTVSMGLEILESNGPRGGQGPRTAVTCHLGAKPSWRRLCRGGRNAVASWVATVDEGAVRNTRDVNLLVRRCDLPTVTAVLEQAGFVADELLDVVMFRDGPEGKPSAAIRLLFAGEKTRSEHPFAAPEIQTSVDPANFRVITLESLVAMKLMSNRDKDRTHLRDLIGVQLVDASWLPKLPAGTGRAIASHSRLAGRLKRTLALKKPGRALRPREVVTGSPTAQHFIW